jgi:predicted RNA-binding protein with PUA-like domain
MTKRPKTTRTTKRKSETKRTAGAPANKTRAAQPKKPAATSYRCFLIKSEPFVYSFDQLLADGRTVWDGVRNYEARNTLRSMKKGDTLLFYHSNEGLEIVGLARVACEAYQDPTTDEDWSAIDIEPIKKLRKPVSLATIKAHPLLSKMALVRRNRISVTPVTDAELAAVLKLSDTKL